LGGVLSIRSKTSSSRFWPGVLSMQSDPLDDKTCYGEDAPETAVVSFAT
jgi:hypothetical protein